ncbi:MAG TPA: hypothetical protein VGJ86_22485 [Acidimicrobiales bacterium]
MRKVTSGQEERQEVGRVIERHEEASGVDAQVLEPPERDRAADMAIIDTLRALNFDAETAEWRTFAAAMVGYAYPILVAWGVKGELRSRAAHTGVRGLGLVPEGMRLDVNDAESLAIEMLSRAIETSRRYALRAWDPGGGASLCTYFVGCCLLQLPRSVEACRSCDQREVLTDPHAIADLIVLSPCDPAEDAEARISSADRAARLEAQLANDPVLKELAELLGQGLTIKAAGKAMGRSASSLHSRLYRLRRRTNSRRSTSDA